MNIKGFEPRLYQQTILHTAVKKNTLVVLPTGLGKTNIAVLLAANRLTNYPQSKILVLAPTRPLCEQHYESLKENLDIEESQVTLFTGTLSPEKRSKIWQESTIIISTPQGMENDIISSKINLEDVSLVVFDEAHRAVGEYAYVYLAKAYLRKAKHARILGLTASPGSESEKIKEVCKNLHVEEIEVRTIQDPDVKSYVQETQIKWVRVDIPDELNQIIGFLKKSYDSKLNEIKKLGFLSSNQTNYSKTTLLDIQRALFSQASGGEKSYELMKSLSLLAEALKVAHAIDLVETQDLKPLMLYFKKLEEESENTKVKAVQNLVRDINFRSALIQTKNLIEKGFEHPKIIKLREIVLEQIKQKADVKIIIFNQFRDSSSRIKEVMDAIGVKSSIFVGQAKKNETGLTQKEQKKILGAFENNEFNCLIATSVAEEGLDIPQVDLVIFYEPVPSAIRTVQRRGRTGRQEKGNVIILIANKTRDETNLWAAQNKEKKMHRAIHDIKTSFNYEPKETQSTLVEQEHSDIKIFVDYREKSSAIIKDLADQGVKIELLKLDVGDYVLSERVVVEYKQMPDFVDSIIDGRLLSQLASLTKYQRPIIIVEGDSDLYSLRKIHPNAIRGMIATIIVSYGIPIFQTKNSKETAGLFLSIAKRESEHFKREATLHSAKPLTDKQVQEYVVSSLPGVGPVLAKPLLKQFKSIKKLVNAQEDELKKVELIGPKKAQRIRQILDKDYEE